MTTPHPVSDAARALLSETQIHAAAGWFFERFLLPQELDVAWTDAVRVAGALVPPEAVPDRKYFDKLLTVEEILEFWPDAKSEREWREEGLDPKPEIDTICGKCNDGLVD